MAIQARTEFAAAINQIASEKGVDTDIIIEAIKQAALAAYRKDLSYRNEAIPDDFEELTAKLNPQSGEIGIFRGEENITPPGFARIAAQTAKQVIAQKLHEAEKGAIFDEYQEKVGTIISGAIQRQEGNTYFVDLGRAEGVMPPSEQVRDEYYGQNQRMKFYIKEIREGGRGPEVVVSRADSGLVKGLFALEVPEIQSGAVEIKIIAREAGGRSKVAVASNQEGVDPVGSLVGQKGVRVQAVINELGEEKIDIVLYAEDPEKFIAAALSPAKDVVIELNEEEKVAKVKVSDSQLSLAIGKGGQNVRLAAKLTGWKIDIEGKGDGVAEPGFNPFEQGKNEKKAEEEGTKEHEQQVGAAAQDDAVAGGVVDDTQVQDDADAGKVVKETEDRIDAAVAEEAVDGQVVEEEAVGEGKKAKEAAADAEADMEEDVETAPSKDFEEVEEKKIEEEEVEKKETQDESDQKK
jgi:transcription termination/antitermination protein NusA